MHTGLLGRAHATFQFDAAERRLAAVQRESFTDLGEEAQSSRCRLFIVSNALHKRSADRDLRVVRRSSRSRSASRFKGY